MFDGEGPLHELAVWHINADIYRQRYSLSWRQFLDEDPDIVYIGQKIMEFEQERQDLDQKRSNL